MTYKDVADMVDEIGIPSAYHHFDEDTEQQPPFVVFYYPGTDDLYADNRNYVRICPLTIELYTDEKDFALENTVAGVLMSHGISYSETEQYISSEKMWQITYETEVLINE